MKHKDKHLLFHNISSIYGLFYNTQVKYFTKLFENVKDELDLTNYKNIIDIGSGTGALCNVLYNQGLKVTGIDPARGMIEVSKKKTKNKPIKFIETDVLAGLPFEDKSFDISISSFVAHGLSKDESSMFISAL